MFRTQKWKDNLSCVKHTEEIGEEQSPARSKAPPQKTRAEIRVESAETQDNVSGQQGLEEIDIKEMEGLSFIPSAVSEPRWALYMCDYKCNKEGSTFFQLAAIVTEGGGAAHTVNLRRQVTTRAGRNKVSEQ